MNLAPKVGALLVSGLAIFVSNDAHGAAQRHGELLWQKAYVGMNEKQIKSIYPSVAQSEDSPDSYSHTHLKDKNFMIGDCRTELDFEFDKNSLISVSINLEDKANMGCQSALHGSVQAKYGPPAKVTFPSGARSEVWNRKGGVTIEVIGGSYPTINEFPITILYYKVGNKSMENAL